MGEMTVPAAAYYGAQTARAVENFPISGLRFSGRFIAARTLPGGPAPAESLRQAHLLEAAVRADERTVAEIRGRIEGAARRLEEAIDWIIGA